ncbi:MAG: 1,4-dihydroxy-2-naphthoyl-CoA synthase [Chloroflexota bacterium]
MTDTIRPAANWQTVKEYTDITYHNAGGVARIAFNRPEIRNAFRSQTVDELIDAFRHAWMAQDVGTILLTGNGPSPKDGVWAFSAGGDQNVRTYGGYAGGYELPRLHVLELQRTIRFMPKVVIAVVPGWAVGGGHSLHVVCDLTIASREHALFHQADATAASFDGGFGSAYLARMVGQKRAREIFFLEKVYTAEDALQMGMVNAAVPHEDLEVTAFEWATTINAKSPTSIRMLKYALNLAEDGLIGQQIFAGEATRLAYMTDETREGRDAFLEKRKPDYSKFPRWA